ncbi:unnamed protein product [Caenorhabditis auriculariae]|uniref:tRNA/rRNA methyltransferase SpoU type domain-containing protein n=1 Tax=Caenorhabditis auriculariae TaxID=2777116 RepID=A0A8S1HVC5_9PELO|nr:unnamed protein product [Caenorhabditis auriculariae]
MIAVDESSIYEDSDQKKVMLSIKDFFEKAGKLECSKDVSGYLSILKKLDIEDLERALPSLSFVVEKGFAPEFLSEINELCAIALSDFSSTRFGRKAALSCLKSLPLKGPRDVWLNFFVLVECLEEPQFHIIRPILPKVDSLLKSLKNGLFAWIWVRTVIVRSLLHSNGWIRAWALEISLEVDVFTLSENTEFITSVILPALDNNDSLWRFLEKGNLDDFLMKLGTLMGAVVLPSESIDILDREGKDKYLLNFLNALGDLTCPTSLYFISTALSSFLPLYSTDSSPFLASFEKIITRAKRIPYDTLRVITLRNLIIFFSKTFKIKLHQEIVEFARISSSLPVAGFNPTATRDLISEVVKNFQGLLIDVRDAICEYHWDREGLRISPEAFLYAAVSQNETNPQFVAEYSQLSWIAIRNSDQVSADKIITHLFCFLTSGHPNEHVFLAAAQLILSYPSFSRIIENRSQKELETIIDFLLRNCQLADGEDKHFIRLEKVVLPWLSAVGPKPNLIQRALDSFDRSSEDIPINRLSYNWRLLESMIELTVSDVVQDKNILEPYIEDVFHLLGPNVLSPLPVKNNSRIERKKFNELDSLWRSSRLAVFRRFAKFKSFDADKMVGDCVDQLDVSASFAEKKHLLLIILHYIPKAKDAASFQRILSSCFNVVSEEKKSQNSLPSLELFLRIGVHCMNDQEALEYFVGKVESQLSISTQNIQIAYVVYSVFHGHKGNLNSLCVNLLMKLSLFGPVPKKDMRVLTYAYSKAFEDKAEKIIPEQPLERLDLVVPRVRFGSCLLVLKAARNKYCAAWACERLVSAIKELDQSSSRSFGLSLAHRQKTRAVELLAFLMEKVDIEKLIEEIFDCCISWIIDPCQQFSIKLVVELILARLCLKSDKFLHKTLEIDKKMAQSRIGSVSSWINVLMLIARGRPSIADRVLIKVYPWISAQNFPLRCTAIAACRLMFGFLDESLKSKYWFIEPLINFDSEPSGNSRRIIDNLCSDFYFAHLHPVNHFDFQTIFSEIPGKTGMPPEEVIPVEVLEESESIEFPRRCSDKKFLEAPSEVYAALTKNTSSAPEMNVSELERGLKDLTIEDSVATENSFQRKVAKDETQLKPENTSLIVVASLVDKPTNLGGICRTSEIFGVDALVISDALLAEDSNFKALSMSAENWQRIETVKPDNLLPYLQALKADGYKIVAAEQTTDSIPMNQFVFPKKCVVVLGDEKEGVPVSLLRAVDQTVEIKQFGNTRSLNVHVTAALFVSKYAEQIFCSV